MTTPIYDFLKNYINQDKTRCHMPGHKGFSNKNKTFYNDTIFPELAKYDITEIKGADELFFSNSIIAQAEKNTSSLYNSSSTSFSAGGSTLCIQTMVSLVATENDSIICARNIHTSFINVCGLLNINPVFIEQDFFDETLVSGNITAKNVEKAIIQNPNACAIYITSPDYLGIIADVASISNVCDKHNIPLLVDNAHGAHLKFLNEDIHPLTLGATMCCDSPHKTLPVLTGGAFLHISKKSTITKEQVKEKMSIFGSTSPSYLIMMSLDLNNKYLAENAKNDFLQMQNRIEKIKNIALNKGFNLKIDDISKLTFNAQDINLN
ncbi:MAG: aminotransferase class I/II-fold pyridoxal phosphate-dependent enzyme, partial [Oscillospiraceae bacterium]